MLAAHQMGLSTDSPRRPPAVLAHTGSHYVWDLALDDQSSVRSYW